MLKSSGSSSSSLYSLDKNTDEKIETLLKKQFEIKQPHITVPPPPELPESFNSFSTSESNPGCKDPKSIRFKTFLHNTLLDTLKKRGWKETDDESEWDVYWADIHWIHENFDHVYLNDHQKINHFRNHYELTRKDLLVKNVKRMIKTVDKEYGKAEAAKFDFISTSFVLPQDYALFQEEFKKNPGSIWIMKPVGRAQGKGIFLINKISQINQWKKDPRLTRSSSESQDQVETYIIQRYIDNPYLIGGKKFDIRIYALVLSYSPLTVYIHRNGFCRFSNSNFTMDTKDISNLYIHATNVAIQKTSPNYNVGKGCKWLLYNLRNYLSSKHGEEVVDTLMTNIETLIVRSLMSVQKIMINDKHCFELYGFDILIDQEFKPWLLEVNASPSLTAETHWDYELKFDVINDMFDVIDMEKNVPAEKKPLHKVGGFDLVYHDGPIQHERSSTYKSYLGCYKSIPKREKRTKKHSHNFTNISDSSIQK